MSAVDVQRVVVQHANGLRWIRRPDIAASSIYRGADHRVVLDVDVDEALSIEKSTGRLSVHAGVEQPSRMCFLIG